MTSDHDALREQAGPYALGTLNDAERAEFAAHLRTCDACRQEARAMARVVTGMGQTMDPVDPPAHLRARVLAAATGARQAAEPVTTHDVVSTSSSDAMKWLAIAASLVAVLTGVMAWRAQRDAASARHELAAVQRELAATEQRVATLQDAASQAQQTNTILGAADLSQVNLSGQAAAPVAAGRVFWSPSHGLVFSATNLPPLPPGRVYQLWIVSDAPHSAGIVTPNAVGHLNVVSATPGNVRAKAFALTIEPEGGRPAPTGPMYLLGSM